MDDPWAALAVTPAPAAAPAAVSAAPAASADPWAALATPAAPAAPAADASQPRMYDEYDDKGQWIGLAQEGYQSERARPQGAPPPDAKSGYLANVAAGGNAAVAGTLGLPVDLATGGINLATRGINAVTGTNIPAIVDPVGGSASIKRAMGVIGANPDDVKADGLGQEIARGVGGGIVSAALPAGVVAGAVRGGAMAAQTAPRVLSVLGDLTPQNALLGAASGGAGEAAAAQVPDQWKPVAGMAGGIAGVGVPLAAAAGARGAVRAAGDYLAPVTGRVNPLLDSIGDVLTDGSGAPINRLSGKPLEATDNQTRMAADRLRSMASDPNAVALKLNEQGPPTFGGAPTTAQLTRDPGLLASERGIAVGTPDAQKAFLQRAADQNDQRVRVLDGVATGADTRALPAEVQRKAAAADTQAAAHVAATQSAADAEVARVRAEGEARVGQLGQAAEQTRAAMGGDLRPGSEGDVGAAVRAPVVEANAAAKEREGRLWQAIDPDGTLAVDLRPVKLGRETFLADLPELEDKPDGKFGGILKDIGNAADTVSFKSLAALRGRITRAIREARLDGEHQTERGLSIMLDHVHEAMSESVAAKAGADARAVSNGTLAADQTSAALLRRQVEAWQSEVNAAESEAISNHRGSSGGTEPGGSGEVSSVGGAAHASGGGAQLRGGTETAAPSGRVSSGAANEVAIPFSGSNRKPESLADFLIARGGIQDQHGDLRAMDAQLYHHRNAGRLINPKGLTLDYAREAAAEAGFLSPNADINELLDALGEHLSGNTRYRMHEQDIGANWGQTARDAKTTEEARYDATDRVNVAADETGIRLTKAERDHAIDLHMQGVHEDDAIRQAAAASEGAAFDRNAAAYAFGSPGVPIAERQADNGLTGRTRLEPNFDAAAQARYAAARAATAERKGGFDGAPGVKSILQGGPTSGSFKVADAGVPASVIRTGPSGADHVRVYLEKGGSVEALTEAAAFSLRRDAMTDGVIDPQKYLRWAQQRSSFLSALPDAAARFGSAADAQSALNAGTKSADVALKDAVKAAQKTVDEAVAARATQAKARQDSALGKFLGPNAEADPVTQVAALMRRPTAVADMRLLVSQVQGNPDALAGLQRSISEFVMRDLAGDAKLGGGEERLLHGAQLQKFIRQREDVLREVLTPEQLRAMKGVAASLERSNLSVAGSRIGGGSDTAQKAVASNFLGHLVDKIGTNLPGAFTSLGGVIGSTVGGGAGALVGGAVGAGGGWAAQALQASRAAGLKTVDDLVATAMLHPELAAVLMARVTDQNRASLGRALISQLGRISAVSGNVGQSDRDRPAPPQTRQNALLH
jgi:hypothetical protein